MNKSKLNRRIWKIVASRRIERALESATIFDRHLRPFADPQLFPSDRDLGPFKAFRELEERERASVTTRPAYIEPQSGWAVIYPAHLVARGLINIHSVPPPGFRAHLRRLVSPGTEVPAVINLRDRGERHYGHVMQDLVGGRLRMAGECGLDVPVVVSDALWQRPFFQDLLRISGFGDRPFIRQNDEAVRARQVYLFDTTHFSRASIEFLQSALKVPDAAADGNRRLFIIRKPGSVTGRGLSNMDDVGEVCKRFGFELTATDDMSLPEQIELFSQTRVLAGVHGSALVNMVFRKGRKLTLLEIFPSGTDLDRLRPWCFYEAAVLGHDYEFLHAGPSHDGITGKQAYRRDFYLDTDELAMKMGAILSRL